MRLAITSWLALSSVFDRYFRTLRFQCLGYRCCYEGRQVLLLLSLFDLHFLPSWQTSKELAFVKGHLLGAFLGRFTMVKVYIVAWRGRLDSSARLPEYEWLSTTPFIISLTPSQPRKATVEQAELTCATSEVSRHTHGRYAMVPDWASHPKYHFESTISAFR